MRPRRSGPPRARGFTLVELMVAVTGGLFVSMAVFVLAKNSTAFYQREARAGNATFGAVVGFDRLKADISRAGFLATPNMRRDPRVCGQPTLDSWPAWLSRLSSVFIEAADPDTLPDVLDVTNGLDPDQITLAGSYDSSDQFETGPIFANDSGGHTVQLRGNSAALLRLGYSAAADSATQTTILSRLFGGKVLRIVDKTGREQYGVVTAATGGTTPSLTLTNAPPLQYRATSALGCGFNDLGVGSLANVVNVVRYTLRDATALTTYTRIRQAGNAAPTDAGRTELVRVELDADGEELAGTLEVVAEYAVDLRFGLTTATVVPGTGTAVANQSALTLVPETADRSVDWAAGDPAVNTGNPRPQLIRAVRARLSVRSREADRTADVGSGVPAGLYRIQLAANKFARVRTMQADIALRNQTGVTWQ